MKLFYFLAFSIVLTFSNLFAQTVTNKPHIIRTVPAFGDCNVDPNLKEIIFEFDQDMNPSWSFMDCPNPIPLSGEMVWKTKRILSLAVTLGPNRLYQAVMNSIMHRNFMNEQGIPLDAYSFLFRTKTTIHSTLMDTIQNRTNYEKFCTYFLTNYAFKDSHGINWKKQLDSIKGSIIKSETESEFGVRLMQILRKANDINLGLGFSSQSFNCADFRLIPQSYNFDAIFNELTDIQASKYNAVYSGKMGDAGYLLIQVLKQNWGEDNAFAIQRLKEMWNCPSIILDLRLNYGGDEAPAKQIVSTLLSNAITYEKTKELNEATGQFDKVVTQTLSPSTASIHYKGKIYVIIGGNNMGSAESIVLMLKQMANVQLIGSSTYGSSSNPKTFQISSSVFAAIPSWQAYDMKDNPIEGNGIEPDLKVEFPEADFIAEDPIIEYIKNRINNTGAVLPLETGELDFRVFPNPAKDMINISWESAPTNGKIDIQLIDSKGNVIFDQSKAPSFSNSLTMSLNLTPYQLQGGLYFVKWTVNHKATIKKLEIQP
jgi:hypothetical protein